MSLCNCTIHLEVNESIISFPIRISKVKQSVFGRVMTLDWFRKDRSNGVGSSLFCATTEFFISQIGRTDQNSGDICVEGEICEGITSD